MKQTKINYLSAYFADDKKTIKELMNKAEIQYACSFNDIFAALCPICDMLDGRGIPLLKVYLDSIKKMSNVGISGYKAGEMLRHYIIVKQIIEQ